jgi:hypothetical protein
VVYTKCAHKHWSCWILHSHLFDSKLCIQGVICHIAAMLKHMAMPAAPAAYSILSLLVLMFPGSPMVLPRQSQMARSLASDPFTRGVQTYWQTRTRNTANALQDWSLQSGGHPLVPMVMSVTWLWHATNTTP